MLNSSWLDTLRVYRNSRRYAAFLKGVDVSLPTGESVRLQVTRVAPVLTERLIRLYPYSFTAEVKAGPYREVGCGEAQHPLLAIQKSISEAVERCLFRALKGTPHGTATSNGWSAHFSAERARSAALHELLERDAVLVHALREVPFLSVSPETIPSWLTAWAKRELAHTEFSRLQLLVSTHGHFPSISVLFANDSGNGVIAHASDTNIDRALIRALGEACRIARLALSGVYRQSSGELFSTASAVQSSGPCEQAVAYAHHRSFPSWMFGSSVHWGQAKVKWLKKVSSFNSNPIPYEFVTVLDSPIVAGYCRSSEVQNLFFGRTLDADRRGELNRKRLDLINPGEGLSALPHFVA